jgi:hypothetical protein
MTQFKRKVAKCRLQIFMFLEKGDRQMSIGAKWARSLLITGVLVASVLVLASMATALEVGEKAPDFTLKSTNGEKISLSQYRGKKLVLIQFYKTDFNPT